VITKDHPFELTDLKLSLPPITLSIDDSIE
jgi:hypothetical protein